MRRGPRAPEENGTSARERSAKERKAKRAKRREEKRLPKMSSAAPPGVPEGFCDLPPVPGLPTLHLDIMRDLMSGPDGAAVIDHLETRWRQRGLAEGDEAEVDAQAEMHACDLDSDQARHKSGALRAGSVVCNHRGQRFTPVQGL